MYCILISEVVHKLFVHILNCIHVTRCSKIHWWLYQNVWVQAWHFLANLLGSHQPCLPHSEFSIYPFVMWRFISMSFLPFPQVLFILSLVYNKPIELGGYVYPDWALAVGWIISISSLVWIPIYMTYRFIKSKGNLKEVSICNVFQRVSFIHIYFVGWSIFIASLLCENSWAPNPELIFFIILGQWDI